MVRTYGDTIDCQLEFVSLFKRLIAISGNTWNVITGERETFLDLVSGADSYFLAEDFLALVNQAASQLPDDAELELSDFPTMRGWMTLAVDTPIYRSKHWDGQAYEHDDYVAGLYWSYDDWHVGGDHVLLAVQVNDPDDVWPFHIFTIHIGPGAEGCSCLVAIEPVWARWFKALWLLLSQRSVTHEIEQKVPRPAARRAEKAERSPMVRVVRLPQRERNTDGTRDVEWQHRWIVSGHWRQQPWGPERKRIRPVWIAPYVKGPDDKPLKEQAHRLFVAEVAE